MTSTPDAVFRPAGETTATGRSTRRGLAPRIRSLGATLGTFALAAALGLTAAPAAAAPTAPATTGASATRTADTALAGQLVQATAPPGLTVVIVAPLTVPPTSAGLLDSSILAEYTSETGTLTAQLDALEGTSVAIGIDPLIIASIQVLGDGAPGTALAWLDRLRMLDNEVFALGYGDADLGYLAEAASGELPMPQGFDFALDSEQGEQGIDPLLWDYDVTGILWPRSGAVSDALVEAATDDQLLLLSSADLAGDAPARSRTRIDGHPAVIADAELTRLFSAAAAAVTPTQRDAVIELLKDGIAERLPAAGANRTVLIALDRDAAYTAVDLDRALVGVRSHPRVTVGTLAELAAAAPAGSVELAGQPLLLESRVTEFRGVLLQEGRVADEARALVEPSLVTDNQRLRTLTTLSSGWATTSDWTTALTEYRERATRLADAVRIEPSSDILLVSNQATLPVTVTNSFAYPVRVRLSVEVSNNRLSLDSPLILEVAADSRGTAEFPVSSVANGQVDLEITVETVGGRALDLPLRLQVTVEAGWEYLAAGVIAGAAVLLFAFGVFRSIRKRRHTGAKDPDPSAEEGDA